jgi:hypothetical protein
LICINATTSFLLVLSQVVNEARHSSRSREIIMASTPVEVRKAAPVPANAPDAWRSMRAEMDRLFDRFAGGWGMPSLRRMFDVEFEAQSAVAMTRKGADDIAWRACARCRRLSEPADSWYWIGGGDLASKRVSTVLLILFSLADTEVAPQAPVLTIPAG